MNFDPKETRPTDLLIGRSRNTNRKWTNYGSEVVKILNARTESERGHFPWNVAGNDGVNVNNNYELGETRGDGDEVNNMIDEVSKHDANSDSENDNNDDKQLEGNGRDELGENGAYKPREGVGGSRYGIGTIKNTLQSDYVNDLNNLRKDYINNLGSKEKSDNSEPDIDSMRELDDIGPYNYKDGDKSDTERHQHDGMKGDLDDGDDPILETEDTDDKHMDPILETEGRGDNLEMGDKGVYNNKDSAQHSDEAAQKQLEDQQKQTNDKTPGHPVALIKFEQNRKNALQPQPPNKERGRDGGHDLRDYRDITMTSKEKRKLEADKRLAAVLKAKFLSHEPPKHQIYDPRRNVEAAQPHQFKPVKVAMKRGNSEIVHRKNVAQNLHRKTKVVPGHHADNPDDRPDGKTESASRHAAVYKPGGSSNHAVRQRHTDS